MSEDSHPFQAVRNAVEILALFEAQISGARKLYGALNHDHNVTGDENGIMLLSALGAYGIDMVRRRNELINMFLGGDIEGVSNSGKDDLSWLVDDPTL